MTPDPDRRLRRDVGVQWERPEEERRDVGVQWERPEEERRDVGVQVDLLTQPLTWRHSVKLVSRSENQSFCPHHVFEASSHELSETAKVMSSCDGVCGVPWQCVSVRADGPGGGALLQHYTARRTCTLLQTADSPALYLLCPALLPRMPLPSPAESKELPHPHCLPSMPLCSISPTTGGRRSASSPPNTPADASEAPPGLIAPLSPRLAEEEEEEEEEEEQKVSLQHNSDECLCIGQTSLKAEKKMSRSLSCNLCRQHKRMEEDADQQPEEHQSCNAAGRPAARIQRTPGEAGGGVEGGAKPAMITPKQVERPRRTMVGPPIRYLLESEEQSHGLWTAIHSRAWRAKLERRHQEEQDGGWQLCQVCGLNFAGRVSLQRHLSVHRAGRRLSFSQKKQLSDSSLRLHHCSHRCHRHGSRDVVAPGGDRAADDIREGDTQREEEEGNALLPAPSKATGWSRHTKRMCRSPRWKSSFLTLKKRRWQEKYAGRQEKRKRSTEEEDEEEEVKRVCTEEDVGCRRRGGGGEEEPHRPRRKMVGPPIRYLVESEEPSYGPLTASRTNQDAASKPRGRTGRPKKVDGHCENGGGASKVVDRSETAERQTGHMVSDRQRGHMVAKGGEEEPQRPRRKMVGPPIRYLVESEELSYGPLTASWTNQDAASKPRGRTGRPKKVDGHCENGGGASKVVDRSETAERQTGHMVRQTGVYRQTYLVHRDLQSGQVSVISPCCVRLQRLP